MFGCVTKVLPNLFGMPKRYIDNVQGVAAAAFRIEDTSFHDCGFGEKLMHAAR